MIDIQYISEAKGNPVGVIVPIEIWHEIEAKEETAYLTKDKTNKNSLNEIWNNEEDDVYVELLEK